VTIFLRNLSTTWEEDLDKLDMDRKVGNRMAKKPCASITARPDALALSPIRKKLDYTQQNHLSKGRWLSTC